MLGQPEGNYRLEGHAAAERPGWATKTGIPQPKWYFLSVLTAVIVVAYSDRFLIGIVLESIKHDLHLSDTELGIITGFAFAIFYSLFGVPIGRIADRGDRPLIVSLALTTWAAMVMLCGAVTGFWQLALVRIGAAVGESGSMPATYSLIGDYFRGRALTRAMTIYMTSPNLCVLLGFLGGGWLADHYGWRTALVFAGIPGLLLAVVAKITLPEPRRNEDRASDNAGHHPSAKDKTPPFSAVARTMWRTRSCRFIVVALVCWQIYSSAAWTWISPFLIRRYQMSASAIGIWLGLGASLAGILGTLAGGYLLDRYLGEREPAQMRTIASIIFLSIISNIVFLTVNNRYAALAGFILVVALSSSFYGPVYAIAQRLVASRMRATAMSIILMLINLLGLGLGPAVVGALSDLYTHRLGASALGAAMLTTSIPAMSACALFFWASARTLAQDLTAAVALSCNEIEIGESDDKHSRFPGATDSRAAHLSEV